MLGVDQSSNSMFWVMKEAPTFNQITLMALQKFFSYCVMAETFY